jgi:DNA-binding transcriptional MerR regulator
MNGVWTLAELTAEAASALSDGRSPQLNGRVRDLPNERMVRWYVTIGLVDPPLSRRGRVALYGPRHLLQVVAVKRRQSAGRSIADIQAELTGATDDTLRAVARIAPRDGAKPDRRAAAAATPTAAGSTGIGPAHEGDGTPGPGPHAADAPDRGATGIAPRRFWAQRPAVPGDAPGDDRGERPAATLVHGIRLAPGATLLLDTSLSADDAAAILAAAAPLIEVLTERGLT